MKFNLSSIYIHSMAWYVVFHGRQPGVYDDWAACHAQVSGFSNACFKKYGTRDEAMKAFHAVYGQEKKKEQIKKAEEIKKGCNFVTQCTVIMTQVVGVLIILLLVKAIFGM